MKRLILSIFVALCCFATAQAVPAWRGIVSYTQPDGSVIRIRLHGDEFCHWVTDVSGNYLEMDADGYYRPASEADLMARRMAGMSRRSAANARRRHSPAKAGIATGQKRFLVILVEFKDVSFTNGQSAFDNLLNQQGYSLNGGTGSARDFYYDNSGGNFEPIFDVYGPIKLNNNRAYYGGNDSRGDDLRPEVAVKEGCQGLNSSIDFSRYDNDNDGEVDLVFMYYAGQGESDGGPEESIWPHQWDLTSGGINLTLDGKKVNKYACSNEIVSYGELAGKLCGIGTACHEFGHAMGLPDFYDTDYDDNGEAGGLYDYSTMCGGSYNNEGRTPPYFNIEERIMLGWLQPGVVREFESSGSYTLTGINNNVAYKTPTDMDGEYFVYECRSLTDWDAYLPEPGLIVYHVDKSSRTIQLDSGSSTAYDLWNSWETYNSINENGNHPCFYVVPAGDQSNLNYTKSRWAFPGTANPRYTSFTARSWNGVMSDIQLSDISYSGNKVTLYATVLSSTLNYNVIANPNSGLYPEGYVFPLELVTSQAQPVSSVSWYFDDEPVSASSVILTAGAHVVEAHLTLVSGETKIVELTLQVQ